MAHIVKCPVCNKTLDADIEPYVKVSKGRRYAHPDCAAQANLTITTEKTPRKEPEHLVKCKYCNKQFDANKEEFVKINNRYAHKKCAEDYETMMSEEDLAKLKLEKYIMKLFDTEFVSPLIQKTIKQFIEEYKYSYKGIHKTLVYFYEVKHNDISKANGNIAIVPYVYQKAHDYYYSIWLAQQANQDEDIVKYAVKQQEHKVKEIIIPPPKRIVKRRKLFDFLDEKEND